MTIPRIIHQIWLGPELPADIAAWQQTWQTLHPSWSYRLWRDHDFDWLANSQQFLAAPSPAIKADVARLEVLEREGGVYIDSDIEAHRCIEDLVGSASLVLLSEGDLLTNAFVASVPHHPVIHEAIRMIGVMRDEEFTISEWDLPRTGPLLLTQAAVSVGTVFDPATRILAAETIQLPRTSRTDVVALARQRRWATHHARATWRRKSSLPQRIRATRLKTRVRRFFDLSAP